MLIGIVVGYRIYVYATDDFRLANIDYDPPNTLSWFTPPLSESEVHELKGILKQKYYYLGKGAQIYAFSSEDNKFVLKFFKFKHIRPSIFVEWLPPISPFFQYKQKKIAEKEKKILNIFQAYKTAFTADRENAGLLFMHLDVDSEYRLPVTLVDKLGRHLNIDLDDYVFIIQKKGMPLREVLAGHFKRNEIAEAKARVHAIFDMYLDEYKKGIFDHDHGVDRNTGFVGDIPLHLDVGKFSIGDDFKSKDFYEHDLGLVAYKLKEWVEKAYPSHAEEMEACMQDYFVQQLGKPVDFKNCREDLKKLRHSMR
jgi:hypothetical protein